MTHTNASFIDAQVEAFRADLIKGLSEHEKRISSKYLYDARGSELFDRICETKDYYLTRTELGILKTALPQISDAIGPGAVVIEPGAGSGEKVRMLLNALDTPTGVIPLDISENYVNRSAELLRETFPELHVVPLCGDFTNPPPPPPPPEGTRSTLVFFPGSTYGNFDNAARAQLMRSFRSLAGDDGRMLLGLDLVKDSGVLERAYDDSEGVTAAFTRNLLDRAQSELGATLDADALKPEAVWNAADRRVELGVRAVSPTEIRVPRPESDSDDFRAALAEGERILTEYSCKFELDSFAADEALPAGFEPERVWMDEQSWFAVVLLRAV
ncbi:MAG: L-histidine N(alpha)-methyltransferase [Planctomycetota bacterium]